MQDLPRAFAALGSYRQFIVCQLAERDGKTIKLPLDYRTMRAGNPHDPAIWQSFEECQPYLLNDTYKIGFVFTAADPFFFLDIDHCIDDQGNQNEISQYLLSMFPGAAVEFSQSGTGLHIFGTGACPPHGCKNVSLGIELYTQDRFVMMTGTGASGDSRTDHGPALASIVESYFPLRQSIDEGEWSDEAHPDWEGPADDEILVAKAMGAKSANSVFGGKASFADLYLANVPVLSAVYPDQGGREYDASSADAALAQHLAFWTGNNHERILRIMRTSALVREKWDAREDYYLPRTIRNATGRQTSFYNSGHRAPSTVQPAPQGVSSLPTAPPGGKTTVTTGYQFMSVEEQQTYFAGCVYVRDTHRVFVPDGQFLRSEQFKASFGGYVFALESSGVKTTKNAFEVFTESQAIRFPKVHGHAFRPALPTGAIIEEEGRTYVNTYVPIETRRAVGDPARFLDLVERIIPDERDRTILLSYLAGWVQYPGIKFQYCPVVQGAEGNGKSTIGRCIEFAIGRRYTHQPNSAELARGGGKFTSWIDRKLAIIVEEIHAENKAGGVLDILKPLITNDRIESQAKGADQVMSDNVANWIMFCNRKDDVPVTTDTRRYAIFYSAQQTKADCTAAGMTDSYWRDLYRWLREEDGFAIVNNWLRSYEILDEFNPALISRAPSTSNTAEAITLTRSDLEQKVTFAMDTDMVGFRGGWVSSIKLNEYLEKTRIPCPPSKRRAMLQALGYDWHPGMVGARGRASSVIVPEAGRPTLYVKRDHMSYNIMNPHEVQAAYEKAQGYAPDPAVFQSNEAAQ
jgi:hypothetical protein